MCYKDDIQAGLGTHVACHGYVKDATSLEYKGSTHRGEKADSTIKNTRGDPVWPGLDKLWAAPEIGYGHLD